MAKKVEKSFGIQVYKSHLLNANIAANRSTGRFKQQIVKTERMWSVERIARQSEELGDYDKFTTPEENK